MNIKGQPQRKTASLTYESKSTEHTEVQLLINVYPSLTS